MTGLALALIAGSGVYMLWSSLTGTRVERPPLRPSSRHRGRSIDDWLAQAGLAGVRPGAFAATMAALFVLGLLIGWTIFGGAITGLAAGCILAALPITSYRARRERLMAEARSAWPRLIEEIRLSTSSLGRSIPQALLEAGAGAPPPMRPAFAAAAREWRISTDFERTVAVLQRALADPTADAACETLLVAHEVGGADLDRRLRALAEDRMLDLQGRKDAAAKQAGVRFARRFVLIVPLGMALAGMSIGTGRAAYQTPTGQAAVVVGLGLMAACWVWAGHHLRLPQEDRVFRGASR